MKVLDFVQEKPSDPGWNDIPHTIVWNVQSKGQSKGQSRTSPATLFNLRDIYITY